MAKISENRKIDMPFPLLHKRVLLIRPIETGDFPNQLINRLVEDGAKVYIWTWSIEDAVLVLDRLPQICTPIMIDDSIIHPAAPLLRLLPPIDFIIKFSVTNETLDPSFITRYGYILDQHRHKEIKGAKRAVKSIVKKLQNVNGGLILNVGPERKDPVSNVITKVRKMSKTVDRNPGTSTSTAHNENSHLLPHSDVGVSDNDEGENYDGVLHSFSQLFCCCFWDTTTTGIGDIDDRIRQRLRGIHMDARNRWLSQILDCPNEKKTFEKDLVRKQSNALIDITGRSWVRS